MKILLINVSLRPDSLVKMFPLGLGYIMTAIKNSGHSFDFIDIDAYRYSAGEVDELIQEMDYDVVCFGCIVTGYRIAKDLAARVRKFQPQSTIIVGNTVASSIPEILLKHTEADVAVMGEGDITIVELLHAFENQQSLEGVAGICYLNDGVLQRTVQREAIRDLDLLPMMDYSIFDIDIYIDNLKHQVPSTLPVPQEQIRGLPVNTARGCIGRCTFCYHSFQHDTYRRRSNQVLLDEIRHLLQQYNLNYFPMADELTFYKKQQALDFAKDVLDSGLKFMWPAQCRADLFDSEDDLAIVKKMQQAGCVGAFFSLESAAPEILKAMNKNISVERFVFQTKLFQRAGVPVNTSLVFGYPQETVGTIRKTFDVCIECDLYPSSGFLLPQPGSMMYEYAIGNGYIPSEEAYLLQIGDRQDLHLNMTQMSDERFLESVEVGAQRCNESLGLGMAAGALIKTGHYRGNKKDVGQ